LTPCSKEKLISRRIDTAKYIDLGFLPKQCAL